MSTAPHRDIQKAIDIHFKGRGTPQNHALIMEHLPDCPDCHQYFKKRMFLAEMIPGAPTQQERIGATVGLSAPRAPRAMGFSAFVSAAAMAAGVFLVWPTTQSSDDGFQSRGNKDRVVAPVESQEVFAYVASDGAENALVKKEIRHSDELIFSYRNNSSASHLMVYGVDEQKNVYWYHPAWVDAADNPSAVPIAQSEKVIALPLAVAHAYQGANLQLFALFLNEREAGMTVQNLERLLENDGQGLKEKNLAPKMLHNLQIIR